MGSRPHDVDAPHVADAAHRANAACTTSDLLELASEPRTILTNGREEGGVRQSLDDVAGHGGYERASAERRSVVAGLHRRGNGVRHENGTHGKTASDRL